jgi:hypothetical protein
MSGLQDHQVSTTAIFDTKGTKGSDEVINEHQLSGTELRHRRGKRRFNYTVPSMLFPWILQS